MLTLNPGKLMARELGLDARPNRAAHFVIDLEMPMVYESQVADAVCHLVSGLLIVEGLGETSRQPRCSVAALAVTAQSISTALEDLNECSIGFWSLLPQTRTRTSEPIPGCRRPFRCGRNPTREHAVETKPRVHYVPESLTQGSIVELHGSIRQDKLEARQMDHVSISQSEWEESLASAVLHLVGAYRVMETLSASAFPAGAPGSFKTATHCLCTALVALDRCLTGSDNLARSSLHGSRVAEAFEDRKCREAPDGRDWLRNPSPGSPVSDGTGEPGSNGGVGVTLGRRDLPRSR